LCRRRSSLAATLEGIVVPVGVIVGHLAWAASILDVTAFALDDGGAVPVDNQLARAVTGAVNEVNALLWWRCRLLDDDVTVRVENELAGWRL
jgi:hypothetical protein